MNSLTYISTAQSLLHSPPHTVVLGVCFLILFHFKIFHFWNPNASVEEH